MSGFTRGVVVGAVAFALMFGGLGAEAATIAAKDADRDGVVDRLDLCPATRAGARVVSHGCTALDIALDPQSLVDAAVARLTEQSASLSSKAAYAGAAHSLEEGAEALSRAAAEMRRGEVCEAADLAELAAGDLEAARREISGIAVSHATTVAERAEQTGEESELGVAMLPSLTSEVALDLAAQAAPFFRAACAEQVGRFKARGIVTEVRDFERKFRIGKGSLIGLAEGYYPVGPVKGMEIEVSGVRFADGSRLATTVRGKAPQQEFLKTQQCLELWIAPFQKFPPFSPSTNYAWGRYPLDGYASGVFGVLNLERRQRFTAFDNNCPDSSNLLTTVSHSMKIDVTQGGNTWTIATNLKDGNVPVDLPSAWVDNSGGTVSAIVQKTTCTLGCTTTTLGTHTVGIYVRPTGSYATLVYDKTLFDVGGNSVTGSADLDRAKVTGFNLSFISNSTAPSLDARGYQAPLGQSADTFADFIGLDKPFAIFDSDFQYDDDMYDDEQIGFLEIAEFKRTGVDRPSGLVWPQAKGTFNGKTYAYSAKVPTVVRDLIVNCPGSLNSHYEMPFSGTSYGGVIVTKGNSDDPAIGHTGTASFALDFVGPSGQWVYAARPGVVFSMDVNNSTNASEPSASAIGNFILVRHQDYTFGLYYHLAQNSAPSSIEFGQRVFRDTHIANFGGGKLHFEVGDICHPIACSSLSGYDSVKVLYDAWVDTLAPPALWISTHKTCYVPRVNDKF